LNEKRHRDDVEDDEATIRVDPSDASDAGSEPPVDSRAGAEEHGRTRLKGEPDTASADSDAEPDDEDATRIAAPPKSDAADEATRLAPETDDGRRVAPSAEYDVDQTVAAGRSRGQSDAEAPAPAAFETMQSTSSPRSETPVAEHGDLVVGSVLRQRFRIESTLGEGGMGKVFQAVDLLKQEAGDTEVHVALKVIKPEVGDVAATFVSLQREARRAQQLAHPNIVTVYDFDRADGHIYMTMEHLRGSPLSDLLKKNRHGLDPAQARDIVTQVAAGLAYAHAEGIVHVDLKPQNVFLLDSGRVKILDFGIAKAWQEKSRVGEDSFSGYSPPYASTELIAGQPPTPRDDVYALAIVAYALFTGKHPFDWKPADQAREAGMRPVRDASFRRSEWRAIRQGLGFDAEARPADAREFLKRFAPSRIKRAAAAVSIGSVVAALAFVVLFQPEAGPEIPFEQLDPAVRERLTGEIQDAETFAELGDFDSAIQLYNAVLLAHPGNLRATEGMNETVEQVVSRIGQLYRQGRLSNSDVLASLQSLRAYDALPARAHQRIDALETNL